jgi:hypothetical protein
MGSNPTKAADNMYCRCRKEAAKYNDRLNSREGAAELLGLSQSSLADYELGLTKVVPVDKVALMIDLYNAPELRNFYCTNVCPLGAGCIQKIELKDLDRITIQVLSAFQAVEGIKEALIEITADGKISEEEKPELVKILTQLDKLSTNSQELKLWVEKNLK